MGIFDKLYKLLFPESEEKILRTRLEEVFATEFKDFEVRKDVPVLELEYTECTLKYSYGLYYNGMMRAVIMVHTDRNNMSKKCCHTSLLFWLLFPH